LGNRRDAVMALASVIHARRLHDAQQSL